MCRVQLSPWSFAMERSLFRHLKPGVPLILDLKVPPVFRKGDQALSLSLSTLQCCTVVVTNSFSWCPRQPKVAPPSSDVGSMCSLTRARFMRSPPCSPVSQLGRQALASAHHPLAGEFDTRVALPWICSMALRALSSRVAAGP